MAKNNNTDPYKQELLDIAKEIGADVVIQFHTATITLNIKQLEYLRTKGFKTDILSCVIGGFLMAGKTQEEIRAFMNEADDAKSGVSVQFKSPDGGALNIKSKEENPMMYKMVEAVEKGN